MNIPMSWLKSYVDIDCSTKDFTDIMTMAGQKVETVEYMGKEFCNVIVGKILKIEKHPNADKLVVCTVDVGDKTLTIATGATNVKEGQYVPVATDGAVLHNDKRIKNSKLRGVESQGMLCSIDELGYNNTVYPEAPEDGIYIFPDEQPLGADALSILEIKEDIVEFEITSNRPDCYSIIGIAREAAAAFGKGLKYPELNVCEKAGGDVSEHVSVEIENPKLCPRYAARAVKNVKIGPSPQWMRHRLISAGIRPINNIVDITNYVMLELGQPLHAFDSGGVKDGKIIVRNAKEGEIITTLDGTERRLDPSMLVISDPEKAIAIAGVMGGENSKVTGESGAVIFESANFNGPNIRKTSKKLGLRTDASGKYEKGLDPNLSIDAVNRCANLVEELGAGEVVKGIADCYPNKREYREVVFNPENINRLIGFDLSKERMDSILKSLNIEVKGDTAIIPTYRADIEGEADIAEEIARIYGYDNIEAVIAAGTPTVGGKNRKQRLEDMIKNTAVSLGFSEGMTFSFESPKVFDKLMLDESSPLRETVNIINPLGEDYSIMRTSAINGMLNSLANNYNMRNDEAMLFELGKKYIPKALPLTELPDEREALTLGMYSMKDKANGFFHLKGVLEQLFEVLGMADIAVYEAFKDLSYMHQGRCASITVNGENAGYFGEVHPAVCAKYGIGEKVYLADLELDILYSNANTVREYKPLPKYPAVLRDIAMVVSDNVTVKQIEDIIKQSAGKMLESVKLFDIYKGAQIAEGFKSVAYSIAFRAEERTLTDDEVAAKMERIVKKLKEDIKAVLRDK